MPLRSETRGNGLADATLDVVGVGEEEPIIEPVDQHSRDDPRRGMDAHIGVAVHALHITQNGVVRIGAAANGVHDREGYGQQQRL